MVKIIEVPVQTIHGELPQRQDLFEHPKKVRHTPYRERPELTKTFVDNDENLRHISLMAPQAKRPTKLELEILRVLWESGPQSVREIQQRLESKSKPAGYTTVLKMVQIMNTKGLVERDETTRPQIYRARHSQQHTQRQLLRDLISRAFDGSVKALVLQALATKRSSPEDIKAIEKLLDRIEGGSK
jgi:predicted transcriptional regulator